MQPLPIAPPNGAQDINITGLSCDSRAVRPGFLFGAFKGSRADGTAYIGDAAARGAVAVVADADAAAIVRGAGLPLIANGEPRRLYALMAARLFGAQPDIVVAVTGTNAKSSVVSFTRQIWERLGHAAASLGTLGIQAPSLDRPGALTTPDAAVLHAELAELAASGVDRLALEASSHGLDQYRLDGVRLRAAAFTNLSRDHLDYHGTMARYLASKIRLFSDILAADGVAVINADSSVADPLIAVCGNRGVRVIRYGRRNKDAEVLLVAATPRADGQDLTLRIEGAETRLATGLVGDFQADNLLCALGLVIATGADKGAAVAALAHVVGVPGRVERIAVLPSKASIYVDYAHTPDGLKVLLRALRPHVSGALVVVFGCGGDRDAGKRPEMGRIADRLADRIVVTDDNPRGENAAAIRKQILEACPRAEEIADRATAIETAIAGLDAGDVLVIAGKGHETGQIVGDRVIPFSDAAVARAAAHRLGAEVAP